MEQSFGEFLSQKRKEKKLTQRELAKMLFVSESAVSKWEKDVAHPDITLLPKISEILGVTEHELITASIDKQKELEKKQAKKWRHLTLTWDLFFAISYGITLFVCFLVDLIQNKTFTWSALVFFAILLSASITSFPKQFKKYKLLLSVLTQTLSLIFLLLVCNIYSGGNWFFVASLSSLCLINLIFLPIILSVYNLPKLVKNNNAVLTIIVEFILIFLLMIVLNNTYGGNWLFCLGLPFLLVGFVITLLTIIILRYLKVNGLVKTSLCLIYFAGLFIGGGYLIPLYLEKVGVDMSESLPYEPFKFDFANWQEENISNNVLFIIFATMILLSAIFFVFGIAKHKNKSRK